MLLHRVYILQSDQRKSLSTIRMRRLSAIRGMSESGRLPLRRLLAVCLSSLYSAELSQQALDTMADHHPLGSRVLAPPKAEQSPQDVLKHLGNILTLRSYVWNRLETAREVCTKKHAAQPWEQLEAELLQSFRRYSITRVERAGAATLRDVGNLAEEVSALALDVQQPGSAADRVANKVVSHGLPLFSLAATDSKFLWQHEPETSRRIDVAVKAYKGWEDEQRQATMVRFLTSCSCGSNPDQKCSNKRQSCQNPQNRSLQTAKYTSNSMITLKVSVLRHHHHHRPPWAQSTCPFSFPLGISSSCCIRQVNTGCPLSSSSS